MITFDYNHTLLLNTRKLFVRDYQVLMSIGVYEDEKQTLQPVLFNIEAYIELPNETKDTINEVFDYNHIIETIKRIAHSKHFELQETLCDECMIALLSYPEISAVKLSTEKTNAYAECYSVGVERLVIKQK
jgi:dihydroneopterin aldolase